MMDILLIPFSIGVRIGNALVLLSLSIIIHIAHWQVLSGDAPPGKTANSALPYR